MDSRHHVQILQILFSPTTAPWLLLTFLSFRWRYFIVVSCWPCLCRAFDQQLKLKLKTRMRNSPHWRCLTSLWTAVKRTFTSCCVWVLSVMHSETDSGSFQPSSTAAPLTGFRYAHANLYPVLVTALTVTFLVMKRSITACYWVALSKSQQPTSGLMQLALYC